MDGQRQAIRRILFTIIIYEGIMLIIFQPIVNQKPRLSFLHLFIIIIAINAAEVSTPSELNFTTPYTNCTISFTQSKIPQATTSQFIFYSCYMAKCKSLGAGQKCRQFVNFALEESTCYERCCGTDSFNPNLCMENNQLLETRTQRSEQYLLLIFAIVILVLLLVILLFAVKDLRCCEEKQSLPAPEVVAVWRQSKYQDHKCNICDQYGAVIETYCKHYFHMDCFKEGMGERELKGQCLVCEEISKKYRIWCGDCHEKYIKIGGGAVKKVVQLEKELEEAKILHDDCLKDLFCSAKTDLRLTNSTND